MVPRPVTTTRLDAHAILAFDTADRAPRGLLGARRHHPRRAPPRRAAAGLFALHAASCTCTAPRVEPSPTAPGLLDPAWTELPTPWRCEADPCPLLSYVHVPAARVLLGAQSADPDAPRYDPDATPGDARVREASVGDVWLTVLEVPAVEIGRCIEAGACSEADFGLGPDANRGRPDRPNHPANLVSWHGARAFCAWRGGRLPTEDEWEHAARGADGRRWPWGNEPGCGTGRPDPSAPWSLAIDPGPCRHEGTLDPSELRGRSPFGLIGMAGNVWEWTSDTIAGDDGELRAVQRGGGFAEEDPVDLRTTVRALVPVDTKLPDVGFRCVWEPPERRRAVSP